MTENRWLDDIAWSGGRGGGPSKSRSGKNADSRQARSQRTQDGLLDAAEWLFARQGADATSVAEIAQRANCSVGAVYHHFKDKDALLYALYKRMTDRLQAASAAALDPDRWDGASMTHLLRGYLEYALRIERENPGFKQAAMEALKKDPALQQHYAEVESNFSNGLRKLLLTRRSEITHDNPDLAIRFVLDQYAAMLHSRKETSVRHAQLGKRSDATFIDEALRSACAYLGVR